MTEPDSLVLQLLRGMRDDMQDMREDMRDMREKMATKEDVADLRAEMHSLRADVASYLMTLEKRLGDQIAGMRRSVMEYHSSAIGHGVLISELEDRVRRLEEHLKLAPPETH